MLSTYNGERYLTELLDSLMTQSGISLDLLIRDDHSTDSTMDILRRYQKKYSNIVVYQGENLGVQKSFFDLIKYAHSHNLFYNYYAFCDQDDVWKPNKLHRAITQMELMNEMKEEIPLLYCSITQMVNEQLSPISKWPPIPAKPLTLHHALVENIAVGCTCVINKPSFVYLIENYPKEISNIIMHDWWIYLCISAIGRVCFDTEPTILYRQHNMNILGGGPHSLHMRLILKIYRFIKKKNYYIRRKQAYEFYRCCYLSLDEDQKTTIRKFIQVLEYNFFRRLIFVIHFPFYRQSFFSSLVLRLTYIAGII